MSREFPAHPRIGVAAVVFKADQVLLVRRARPPRQGEWSLPGGLQEVGETVFEAAAREVMEETGVTVRAAGLVDVIDMIERDEPGGRVRWHYTLIDVAALWQAGEPLARDDAAEAAWFSLADVSHMGLWSETARVILRGAELVQASQAPLPAAGQAAVSLP